MDWLYLLEILAFALVNLAFIALGNHLMEKPE